MPVLPAQEPCSVEAALGALRGAFGCTPAQGPRVAGLGCSWKLWTSPSSLRSWGGLGRPVSLCPSPRGQALSTFFRGLCAAHSFSLGRTQCRGELRSDFQPSALDFLSFVGWRTDYATRLPVISALGAPAPWRRSAMGRWEMLLGGDDRGPALRLPITQAQARAAAGR